MMNRKDFASSLVNRLRDLKLHLSMRVATYFIKSFANLIGVHIGARTIFYGSPTLYRYLNSAIIIGSDCRFRSKKSSNLIGINHQCIIATHTSDARIVIGDSCGFSGTVIGAFKNITLGKNVRCGANTLITDADWHLDDKRIGEAKPINIENNVWLGYGVIVMKGVTIGENSIIGAGSVVVHSIPANVIAAGNPCKVIKLLSNE